MAYTEMRVNGRGEVHTSMKLRNPGGEGGGGGGQSRSKGTEHGFVILPPGTSQTPSELLQGGGKLSL